MNMFRQDSSGSQNSIPELRLILVGNIGCGKTLTADTLLNDSLSISTLMPSRLNEVRRGVSEGRRLRVVETPRWYWKGEHIEISVQRETEKALSLVAPGPHAFLILVPVGQFTEMEGRIPTELERVFGRGALEHTLVLLTCGDYLAGRDHERYIKMGEPGLSTMVNECQGHWHVINNRRPENREQVKALLEKVEQLTKSSGGCYLPSPMQRHIKEGIHEEEHERVRSYSLCEEELVNREHSTLSHSTWSKEEIWDESGRRKVRVRSIGPATGREFSREVANGLHSKMWYDDTSVELKPKLSSFKLSKEGAILSQMTETDQPAKNQNNQNFINTIHYHISTMGDTSSPTTPIPSPTISYSHSFKTPSSSSSEVFAPSFPTNISTYSSSTLCSSPTKTLSPSFSTGSSSSPMNRGTFSSSATNFSSSFAFSSFSPYTNTSSSSYNALHASSSTHSASLPTSSSLPPFSASSTFPSASVFSSNTKPSSFFPSTNASTLSFSSTIPTSYFSNTYASSTTTLYPHSTSVSSLFSSDSSDELRLVLLGRSGSGKSAAGNAILGREEFKLRRDDATTQLCAKGTAMIGKKRVTVVDTPDWFWPPENLTTHLSSCMDMCSPGPHAFLLCVPVTLPGRSNLHDLSSLKNSFGPDDIQRHTLVLFTHSDKLKVANVEEYIAAKRPELLELVEKCEDRYHVLMHGRNDGNIEELIGKVEQAVKESGGSHYSCQGQVEVGRERLAQASRGQGEENNVERASSATLHSLREEEEFEQEEKNANTFKSTASSIASVLCSVLQFLGQKAGQGAQQVPKPVAGGAVLGCVLGLYFGGPIGGAVGATAGSAAAEYGRRKYSKPKTD